VTTRRNFLGRLGGAIAGAGALGTQRDALTAWAGPTALELFPADVPASIRVGYASITWNGDDLQAIKDIASLGFTGIQLRSNVLDRFGKEPEALRDLLVQHQLKLVAFSSGAVRIDAASDADTIATHVSHAEFVRRVGGLYLQVTDERPRGRSPVATDYTRLGQLLTEIGKRTADLGIPLGFHNHMGGLGERPDDVRRVLDAADARHVKLLLDVAHYRQADGDPAQAIREYRDRVLLLHIKDVERPAGKTASADGGAPSYRFVELGRGIVDLRGVFDALRTVNFDGWAVIELDSVPDNARSPLQAAALNRSYMEKELGMAIR